MLEEPLRLLLEKKKGTANSLFRRSARLESASLERLLRWTHAGLRHAALTAAISPAAALTSADRAATERPMAADWRNCVRKSLTAVADT